jgi:hypothetical protein
MRPVLLVNSSVIFALYFASFFISYLLSLPLSVLKTSTHSIYYLIGYLRIFFNLRFPYFHNPVSTSCFPNAVLFFGVL